jgi:GTP-binding protein
VLAELRKYDDALYRKPRWLVLNKIDMVPPHHRDELVRAFTRRMRWRGPVFLVSALARDGLKPLVEATWAHVNAARAPAAEAVDVRFAHDNTVSAS